jgi:hypothetical protein
LKWVRNRFEATSASTGGDTVSGIARVNVILSIPKASHYDWDARELAEAHGSTIHTVKELYTFVQDADPRPLVDKNVSYMRNLIAQHTGVESVEMICEASMLIKRRGDLSDVIAAVATSTSSARRHSSGRSNTIPTLKWL